MFTFLTEGAGGAAQNPASSLVTIGMLVVMVVVFYFFGIRPQKKQEKETKAMRDALSVGDEITTIGGIVGKVVNVKDDKIVIETSADQVRLELAKWSISTNETAAAAAKEAEKKKQEARAKAKATKKAEQTKEK